jgi:ribosomal protein S18 acetylase RimI-like enzyme
MKKHIQNFNNFINENKKGKITYSDECLGYHNGQTDMETGIYEDGEIIGMVQYTLYQNELTIKDIIVLPKRRREGFGSMLMNYIKKQNPSYTYVPSMKTELGAKFIHKEINE